MGTLGGGGGAGVVPPRRRRFVVGCSTGPLALQLLRGRTSLVLLHLTTLSTAETIWRF